MFVFVFEAALFKFKQEAPHNAALFQLPPTSASSPCQSLNQKPSAAYTTALPLSLYPTRSAARIWPPRVPASGYAAGCSRERQAPKPVPVPDAALPKYKHDAPHNAASFQSPPTSA